MRLRAWSLMGSSSGEQRVWKLAEWLLYTGWLREVLSCKHAACSSLQTVYDHIYELL